MSNVIPINGNGADVGIPTSTKGTVTPDAAPPTFTEFWQQYPKKVAKLDAEKAWKKLTVAQCADALIGIGVWSSIWLRERQLQFVPNAATWLNGQRWTDETPAQWGMTHQSQRIITSPSSSEDKHTAMPDEVREQLKAFNQKFGTKVNI